ncbi:MAG: molybdenum ABC transporter ATP-binding protein [Woeseia sp.]
MSAETLSLKLRVEFPDFRLELAEDLDLHGVTALFGPSGGGKSTLLRAVAGFETPLEGRIACGQALWFDSETGVNVAPHRRSVGFMFQGAALFPHLDVAGNLAFAEKRSRPATVPVTIRDVVAALDLEPLLGRRIAALSGGERQRVALGRTLLASPELLLLDEPLAALDRTRKAHILPYLEELPRRFRIPTVYVTHAIDEVAQLADRVLVLADGRVQAHGTTASIIERLDLQAFTGRFEAGVLVEAWVVRHEPRLRLTYLDLHGETLTMPMVERAPPGRAVRLRIRARDVAIATTRPEGLSIRNVLAGTVAEIGLEADTGFAEVLIQLRGDRIRARVTQAAVEDLRLERGMTVFALLRSVSFERMG